MPTDPTRGHAALRRGRWSQSGAEYFLTFCTAERRPGLHAPEMIHAIWSANAQLEVDAVWRLRIGTVMPDHLHLLVELGGSKSLPSAIRLFKGRLASALRAAGLRWQSAYFDHRLRADEDRLAVFLYLFLNPYRAGLIETGQRWPGLRCSTSDWSWFEPLTGESLPFPEWLA